MSVYAIELTNMEFRAFHGCYDLEKVVGGRFLVTLLAEAEADGAGADDELAGTVNYVQLYEVVRAQMAVASNVLEHVARRILDAVHAQFPEVVSTCVTVSKLAPPLGGKIEKVSVTLKR